MAVALSGMPTYVVRIFFDYRDKSSMTPIGVFFMPVPACLLVEISKNGSEGLDNIADLQIVHKHLIMKLQVKPIPQNMRKVDGVWITQKRLPTY